MKEFYKKYARLKKENKFIYFKDSGRFYIEEKFYNSSHTPLKFHRPKETVCIEKQEVVPVWQENKDGEYEILRFDTVIKEEE